MSTDNAAEPRRSERHPVRIVHLGLGAFHRAHQAWYTQRANDLDAGAGWGIAAFTGRSPLAAELLNAQDDRYTLIERSAETDDATVIESISAAFDGADADAWRSALSDPSVAIVTLTVTEAGYHAASSGGLDLADPEISADLSRLLDEADDACVTAPGRLVDGLRARRRALGDRANASLAVVSCDNLTDNGGVTRQAVSALAAAIAPDLAAWIDLRVSFVSTMVDRITPATVPADVATAGSLTGFEDPATVVAEPFSEWVLSGAFPAGRPAWERVGARFVDDVEPFERRKLWLLNAGHSLLAYRGLARGHTTVEQAFGDEVCAVEVEALWAEARDVLPLDAADVDESLDALRARWRNPRIEHRLVQIGADGSKKLPLRIIAPMRARTAAGLPIGVAQCDVLAAWTLHLAGAGVDDPGAGTLVEGLRGLDARHRAESVIAVLASDLAGDDDVVGTVAAGILRFERERLMR